MCRGRIYNAPSISCSACAPPHFVFPHTFLAGSEIYDLAEFYEAVERERQAAVDVLVKKYHTIGPVLGKIEEVGCMWARVRRWGGAWIWILIPRLVRGTRYVCADQDDRGSARCEGMRSNTVMACPLRGAMRRGLGRGSLFLLFPPRPTFP